MTSFHEKSQKLIEKAEQCEWNLECDGKLLELMQNVAGKIENRSAATKSNISTMMLNLDETKVKLSNLTRINSIKNTNYCENLIREKDQTPESPSEEVPKTEAVRLSPKIAIENGLKLMDHCFEKHRVNLDPSSGQSKTSIVYRPIDKYMSVLPHLIGSDKWTEKWHVGLLDSDVTSHAGSEKYSESVDSNQVTSSSFQQPSIDESMIAGSSLMASQDSLAKSSSSIGDQMVINKPTELFDDQDIYSSFSNAKSQASNFFRPQPEHRRIVNLFDDEPPSLEQSPIVNRKPANLFDDYGSVDSYPEASISETAPKPKQQPVDLFNDNEFEDFIKKIEEHPGDVIQASPKKPEQNTAQGIVQPDMRKITEEIKKVQLKSTVQKVDHKDHPIMTRNTTHKENQPDVRNQNVQIQNKKKEEEKVDQIDHVSKPRLKKITNLFDDDDDEDDYFDTIVKEKAAIKPTTETIESKPTPAKTKLTNLFDDDDDDNTFEEIFSKKQASSLSPDVGAPMKFEKKSSSLFDDESTLFITENVKRKTTNLFDGENDLSVFKQKQSNIEVVQVKGKPPVPEAPKIAENRVKMVEKTVDKVQELKKSTQSVPETLPDDNENVAEVFPTQTNNVDPVSTEAISDVTSASESAKEKTLPLAKSLSSTLPFLSDEPPDDDDTWDTEDNFEEPEPVFRPKTMDYPVVPIFDDIPPDDDFGAAALESPPHELEEDELPSKAAVSTKKFIAPKDAPSKVDSVIPESTQVRLKNVDELDRSASSDNIRNKMNIFNRKTEEIKTPAPMPKKLPGKLNSNLKINIGALMPGARLPPKEPVEKPIDSVTKDTTPSPVPTSTPSSAPSDTDMNNNSNLLNNDVVKSRPRIQVKRRPSTRRGRQENYQRSVSNDLRENSEVEKEFKSLSVPLTKNLAASIFDDMDDDETIEQSVINKRSKNVESPPPAEPSPMVVTTNKVSVFYDDEEDTRMLLEQSKIEGKIKTTSSSYEKSTVELFANAEDDDDDFLGNSSVTSRNIDKSVTDSVVQSKDSKSVFYDESDDDLFTSKPSIKPAAQNTKPVPKLTQSNSLFDDDEEDELFEAIQKKKSAAAVKKTKKLFDSDEESDPIDVAKGAIPKQIKAQPKKQSLFGDDDSDDDLFSSKPKSSTKAMSTTSKTSTIIKKQSVNAVDDPLKDLLNN